MPVSEFGLVTIVSAVHYRVCAFEILTGEHHPELYATLGRKMAGPIRILDEILRRRRESASGLGPEPVLQSAKSLLDSVCYHLYGSAPLKAMKKALSSPAVLDRPEEISEVPADTGSPELYQVLIRAADQFRFDCRMGLKYMRKVGPLQFGPETAISIYEGGT